MKIKVGNLWDSKDDHIFITGNSFIKNNGELAMGRGSALELKTKDPSIALEFGSIISKTCGHLGIYKIIIIDKYGIFQVKQHFKDEADLDLIDMSCISLNRILVDLNNPTVSMNFPGIGYGRLSVDSVFPIVQQLDDRVTIYIKDRKDLW